MGAILRLVAYLLILVSMLAVQCQQTAEDWNKQGIVTEKQLDHDEAVKAYDEALKLDPNLTMAWYNKGIALFYKGDYKKAADAFAEAITDYDEAIKLNSSDYMAWFQKGSAIDYSVRGSDYSHSPDATVAYEGAIIACDEVIKQNSSDFIAWNTKGQALYYLGRDEEANKAYDRAIEINPRYAEAWYNKGRTLSNDNPTGSVRAYDKAIEIDPQYIDAWYAKGIILFNHQEYIEAVKALNKVVEINPQDVMVWYPLGIALGKLGKYDEAIKAYDKTIELDPSNWVSWDDKAKLQKEIGIVTYYIKYFSTSIDGRGVSFFLSFVDKNTGEFVMPGGKLSITIYPKKILRIYNITENDYNSYIGGIAVKKWISFEELPGISKKSEITGRLVFQDENGVVTTAKEESD